ncbi:MAG: tRNA(His) guanylyltransferase Thg1 family protein [Bryobacteraceae bacterium]
MNKDTFEARMRRFETAHDLSLVPGIFLVARLDGRGFTRLTKELYPFEKPFDSRFRDYMVATVEHLMQAGPRVIYGYTQSDEISLLFGRDDGIFDRRLRKLDSVLAGEASACFSMKLSGIACFDCRISQLPTEESVVDYFRWRQADATRNALNAHCYWLLRQQGKSARQADEALVGLSQPKKNELLFAAGINFAKLPNWQKRGTGFYWESVEKHGRNPKTGEKTIALRRQLKVEMELPKQGAYDEFIRQLLRDSAPGAKRRSLES